MGGLDFVFEQPSDEEPPDLEEIRESGSDSDAPNEFQSPWDFSSYSESVAKEHDRRNTTSIDEKISKARKEHFTPLPNPNDDDDSDVDPPRNQEDQEPEEDDDEVDDSDNNANGKEESFFAPSEGVSFHAKTFLELNLSRPLLRACEALGYTKPTPVQSACIPLALMGRDICGSAITGSGKTASFSLPVLERLLCYPKRVPAIRVLILTPTRELAVQVHSMIGKLAQFTNIRCCLIVGGLSTKEQEVALRSLPDIVVATPGRLIDHLRNSISVDLDSLAVLILDEADRLLEIGFSAEIRELIRLCPKRRQTMLFSATMTEEVNELAKLSLTKPLRLSADPSAKRPEKLIEEVVRIRRSREAHQEAVLFALCSKTFTSQIIIFGGTKEAAHRLMILFGLAGYKAAEFHSGLTQAQRLEALERFRKQEVEFLIATDVAARGLDIVGVRTVINFMCPRDLNSYVHRVGRTARAGREGYAVTFVTDDDRSLLKAIAKRAGSKLRSRIVAEKSVNKWVEIIEEMEDQVSEILQEEKEERVLRKAEMEAAKAENMVKHMEDIFSRPKRTWFVTEKEKKAMARTARDSLGKRKAAGNDVTSVEQAEDLNTKEKRRREQKKLPQKKRRRLEASGEKMLGDGNGNVSVGQNNKGRKDESGASMVELAYRRARAAKGRKRAEDAGKIAKARKMGKKANQTRPRTPQEEVQELFPIDMNNKQGLKAGRTNKSKGSFKSKSRYKRRN